MFKEGFMKIEILGTGCPKCKSLMEIVNEAVKELGIDVEVVKADQISDIMKYNVMITPALVINGEVKLSGKVPSKAEALNIITSSLSKDDAK